MEIFINLWNNWSNTEKISTFLLFFILLVLIPSLIYVLTKNKSLTIFSTASLLSSALFTLLGIMVLNVIFGLTISYIFLFTPFVVLFVNILNIGTSIGYYKLHEKNKNFNYTMLKKEHIKDSIHLSMFILLLFPAFSIFLTSTFLIFTILTMIICLAIIWFNYALLYWIVK